MKNCSILITILILTIFGCNNDPSIEPTLKIESGKITCTNCYGFAEIIEANDDHVFISAYQSIYIFKYNDLDIKHIQTISFSGTSGILSIVVDESSLVFGLAEGDGTGKVFIYNRADDKYVKIQELRIGREGDDFGCDIEIKGDIMIIGADAKWAECWGGPDCSNKDEGHLYIFRKAADEWTLVQKIVPTESKPDDRFGSAVAMYNDILLVLGSPAYIYKNGVDGYELLRTEELGITAVSHNNDKFLFRTGDHQIKAFTLLNDGSFIDKSNIIIGPEPADHGEVLEQYEDFALIGTEMTSECFLYQYVDQVWALVSTFYPDQGESCDLQGLAFTDNFVIIGGRNFDYNYHVNHVYFRPY